MNAEDPAAQAPSQPPHAPAATPGTNPTAGPLPRGTEGDTSAGKNSKKGKKGKKGEPWKWVSIIGAALLAFFFGIANNWSTDLVKGADDCYQALTDYDTNVSSDFWELNHEFHRPGAWDNPSDQEQQQRNRAAARKYNNEVASLHLRILSKCPVAGPGAYLAKKDVDAFNYDYNELSKKCFEAPACSDDHAGDVQLNSVNSAETLIAQAGEVSKWGWAHRGWFAILHPW